MSHVVLICSAAYVEPELEAEFGRIPPAFLALGNRRLFVHQRAAVDERATRILLSLPDDFEPDQTDLDLLRHLDIDVVPVPVGLSLGQSIVYVINVTAVSGSPLTVMHGDTLIQDPGPPEFDAVSVADNVLPGYHWGYVDVNDGQLALRDAQTRHDGTVALSGYFSFSDTAGLVQSITRSRGDFLEGLSDYSRTHKLSTIVPAQYYDFGHVATYHQSRQAVTTQRAFNTLTATRRSITKSGSKPHKIEAEARWFDALPPPMRVYTPAFLGMQKTGTSVSYGLEYLHLPTLSDLFVFGRLPGQTWNSILRSCAEFLDTCATYPGETSGASTSQTLYGDKTMARLEQFARQSGISLTAPCRFGGVWLPSLEHMASLAAAAIPDLPDNHNTLVHGDFCFSNILYDFRADGIRVIDPRGIDANDGFSVFGDIRYDLGKLHHSAIGKYDFIMAGYYDLKQQGPLDLALTLPENESTRVLAALFNRQTFAGRRTDDTAAHWICVLLFLSMLPLHNDEPRRQLALLANAMRMFLASDSGSRT